MMHRRQFLSLATGAASLAFVCSLPAAPARPARFKALAFDAFPLLDPRPIYGLVEDVLPGKGAEISALWKSRQFEYSWLRATGAQYVDFWQVTADALVHATRVAGVMLTVVMSVVITGLLRVVNLRREL